MNTSQAFKGANKTTDQTPDDIDNLNFDVGIEDIMNQMENVGQGAERANNKIKRLLKNRNEKRLILEAYDLQDLGFLRNQSWANLEELNISRNMISNLAGLDEFENLRIINASNNYIEELSVNIYKLENLDVQYNYLKAFPDIAGCKQLRYLNLHSNRLVDFKDVDLSPLSRMKILDLSLNLIQFDIYSDFKEFLEQINLLQSLRTLNVAENPFMVAQSLINDVNLREECIIELKNIEQLNGEEIKKLRQNIVVKEEAPNKEKKKGRVDAKKKIKPPPNLENLLYHLEAANNNPYQALDYLKQLNMDTDLLIEKIEMINEHFAPEKSDEEIQDLIETFMQNTVVLIDNHQDMHDLILQILSKLTIIKFQNFGLCCFNTLKDLMYSEKEMESKVQNVIKTDVINKMKQQDPTLIPVSLLVGLKELLEDTGQTSMLSGMFDMCFPVWLRMYCEQLDACKGTGTQMGNHDHFDAIISLLSVSVNDIENVNKVLECKITPHITKILQQSKWQDDRYIPCLKLIQTLSQQSEKAANQFILKLVHSILMNQIRKRYSVYKKNHSLVEDTKAVPVLDQMYMYETFAAEITTLGSLLNADSDLRMVLLNDYETVVQDILLIMSHRKTDPILLTAICTFCLNLFEVDEIRYDQDRMYKFQKQIKNLVEIMPYLGMEKYPDLLMMSKRYHAAQLKKQQKLQQGKQQKEEEIQVRDITSLKNLEDPIINSLFISIIKLIKFICLEADVPVQFQPNRLFDQMSEKLNEIQRENGLFNCLKVPDDKVRLAVVSCLFVIPLDEYEQEEIDSLTKTVTNCKNIAAGETELVLSTIYWVFARFALGNGEEIESCELFQEKFGERTINEALHILKKNLLRVVDDEDEDLEKISLSVSILNFLKCASTKPQMQKYLTNKNTIFRDILICEELYSSNRIKEIPIDIENSLIGEDINCLIETISGTETVQPYSDVSLRVIMKIGDVLMNQDSNKFYLIEDGHDVIDRLLDHQTKIYSNKLQQETDIWFDIPTSFHKDMSASDQENLIKQHQTFTKSNGQALIKMFLTSKYPRNEEYVKLLCDKRFYEVKYSTGNNKELRDQIDDYEIELETEFKIGQEEQKDYIEDISKSRIVLNEKKGNMRSTTMYESKTELQHEELGSNYHQCKVETDDLDKEENNKIFEKVYKEDLKRDAKDAKLMHNILKEKRKDGFINNKIRNLTIAAFLRCLYSAIEYAPSVDLRRRAIENIKDPLLFRSITQLCDTTDWDESCNIGAKYLRVMRHVIKMAHCQGVESKDMIMHYHMVSIVISKTLQKVYEKMQSNFPLTNGDKITNYELSLTFFTLVQQVSSFEFFEGDLVRLFKEDHLSQQMNTVQKGSQEWKTLQEIKSKLMTDQLDIDKQKIKFKCEYYEEDGCLLEITKKRTVQQKLVEFMVLKLFSPHTLFALVDILFRDMYEDYKMVESTETNELEEIPLAFKGELNSYFQSRQKETPLDNASNKEEDPNKIDVEAYLSIKQVLTIERIKDIVGEIMTTCEKKMKYSILEKIMRSVVFEKKMLRESFMQEILIAAENARLRINLQKFLKNNSYSVYGYYGKSLLKQKDFCKCRSGSKHLSMTDKILQRTKQNETERILELSKVEINNKFIVSIPKGEKEFQRDGLFVERLLVLTTQGIQILKKSVLPNQFMCKRCPESNFCPKGPIQDFCIQYSQIQRIVRCPIMPQKLVIIYTADSYNEQMKKENIQLVFQLTLNIPTFTKCAKILNQLLPIVQCVEDLKKNESIEGQEDVVLNQDNMLTYSDRILQYNIRKIIEQIQDKISRSQINRLELISASLSSITTISNEHKAELFNQIQEDSIIEDQENFSDDPQITPAKGPKISGFMNFLIEQNIESEAVIRPTVQLGIIDKKLFIFREKWQNWNPLQHSEQILQYKANYRKEKKNILSLKSQPDPNTDDMKNSAELQKAMSNLCRRVDNKLFHLISYIDLKEIQHMYIHNGQQPTLEIKCFNNQHSIRILFPGDMERQKFVERLIMQQQGEDDYDLANNDEERQSNMLMDGEDDFDELYQDSEEEEINPIVYD